MLLDGKCALIVAVESPREFIMTERKILPIIVMVIAPLGIATGILATHTVGESISPLSSAQIGFAVALLAMMTAAYILLLDNTINEAHPKFGITLVICGTACVLLALALQFYLAYLSGEHGRHITEIMADNVKRGQSVNVNMDSHFPISVIAIAYLGLFVGAWLAGMGIHTEARRRKSASLASLDSKASDVPG
jgi:hypothetical protein